MAILQELWRDTLRNDAPLGATWMWGGGARWGGGRGGFGCPGPVERDRVRDSGTWWPRWTGGHWGSVRRVWEGYGAGGSTASAPRWGGCGKMKDRTRRVSRMKLSLLPIRKGHVYLLLLLCCSSWCCQRRINQTLPLGCSLFPEPFSAN